MNMIKRLILFSLMLLFMSSYSFAQFTTTTGTIVDGDGTTWFGAKVTATFVPNPAYPNYNQYNIGGVALTSSTYAQYLNQSVQANGSGAFTITLLDNTQIAPGGSTWKFTIQSYTSAPSSTFPNLQISGASQSVTGFIATNITAPRFPAASNQTGGAYGYGINEISVIPIPGGSFFNVTTGSINVWQCTGVAACSWVSQAVGSFCSTAGTCAVNNLTYLAANNVCEASTQTGSDFEAQINACANASYMATGGMITTFGYGNTTQTGTTSLTALNNNSRPITLILNPATTFVFNNVLGTTNSAANCIVPVGTGSSITSMGSTFTRATWQLGTSAVAYDFVCNGTQNGTQEAMRIDGLYLDGNASATLKGSLLHLKNIFVNTRISNVSTFHPYASALTVDNGGDIVFDNDNFNDSASSGQYPGATVVLNCPNNVTFTGGAIQDNGIYNPLLVLNSNNSVTGGCNPSGGGGYQPVKVRFYNVDFEIQAATVGSFAGHATNVDPIQVNDPSDVIFDGMYVYGFRNSTYQVHLVDLIDVNSPNNGGSEGPFEINNLETLYPLWNTSISLIHNTIPNTAAALQDVYGTLNSSAVIGIGKYRYEGSQWLLNNVTDYEDNKRIANAQIDLLETTPGTYASLLPCTNVYEGHIASVTDSTTAIPGRTITGGGSNHVAAYCNGTNWAVASGSSTALSQSFTICPSGCTYTTTICTTSGLAWSSGACYVGNFLWPVPFADNNYSASCISTGIQTGAGVLVTVGGSAGHNASNISVQMSAVTAAAATTSQIDCIGVHN